MQRKYSSPKQTSTKQTAPRERHLTSTAHAPRCEIVRAAWHSASVPISSMTIAWGMWFSTASTMTWCWRSGHATCAYKGCVLVVMCKQRFVFLVLALTTGYMCRQGSGEEHFLLPHIRPLPTCFHVRRCRRHAPFPHTPRHTFCILCASLPLLQPCCSRGAIPHIPHPAPHTLLHPPRVADARVRHVAVAANFVAGVHNHRALGHHVGEHAAHVANGGRLADACERNFLGVGNILRGVTCMQGAHLEPVAVGGGFSVSRAFSEVHGGRGFAVRGALRKAFGGRAADVKVALRRASRTHSGTFGTQFGTFGVGRRQPSYVTHTTVSSGA
eukprot:357178-Chlamydomonas_euryale.AAC.2